MQASYTFDAKPDGGGGWGSPFFFPMKLTPSEAKGYSILTF